MQEAAEAGTWLVGRLNGRQKVTRVEHWSVNEHGSAPMTLTLPGADAILVKGRELDAHKVAELRELAEMVDRCKTPGALADLAKIADWVANWEPGDPGLSLESDGA
ncbi:hypothetical protein GCM10010451_32680 [Streptomyces virens]|uniref:Uncharacterized protein n=2 Tax=Streptomyces TaxID=1883 RepID=A0ABP6PJM1_9ACTN